MKLVSRNRLLAYLALFIFIEIVLLLNVDESIAQIMKSADDSHPVVTNAFRAITVLGLGKWYQWPSGLGVIACVVVYYSLKPGNRLRNRVMTLGQNLLFFFVCTGCAGIITNIIKPILGRARPKLLFQDGIYGFSPLTIHSDWNSMPSGHSTTVFAAAAALAILCPRLRYIWYASAGTIALSRIVVNAHFVADVLFGILVGWGTAKIAEKKFRQIGLLDSIPKSGRQAAQTAP